jgi:hypothetical protein
MFIPGRVTRGMEGLENVFGVSWISGNVEMCKRMILQRGTSGKSLEGGQRMIRDEALAMMEQDAEVGTY